MRTKTSTQLKTTPRLKQKTILLYAGAAFAFAGVCGAFLFFYLNLAPKEEAKAAPVSGQTASSFLFSSSSGTYTEITGGTLVSSNPSHDSRYNNQSIGFTFRYCGTDYTTIGISAKGFIAMGGSVSNSTAPISSGASNNVISALGGDLGPQTSGSEIRTAVTGSAPNRVMTIQWKNFRWRNQSNEEYNFQIKLYETSNMIELVYGDFTKNSSQRSVQIGLRGASNADFNTRTTTTDWSATGTGTANNATCRLRQSGPTVLPASGLTYTFRFPMLWVEDFSLPDGTTSDNGQTEWSTSYAGSGSASVQGQTFVVENTESEAVWTSEVIDISSVNYAEINISLSRFVNNGYLEWLIWQFRSNPDYIRCYYKVDGGPETLFYELISSGIERESNTETLSKVIKGSSLQIIIRAQTTFVESRTCLFGCSSWEPYLDDSYTINFITVSEVRTFYSRNSGAWNNGNNWSVNSFEETQAPLDAGIYPTDREGAIIGNGNTINLTADAETAFLEVHSTGHLVLNARSLSLVRGGGLIIENNANLSGSPNSAVLIDNAPSTDLHIDASNGLDIDKLTLNSGTILNITGSGSFNLDDDFEVNEDDVTINVDIPASIAGDVTSTGQNNRILAASDLTWTGNSWSNNVELTFDGTYDQTLNIDAAKTFHNVVVDKAGGKLILTNPVNISGNMTFTNGKVESSTTNLLIFNDGATATGASDNSYVDGPVRKYGNQDFLFPVGTGLYYAPIEISGMAYGSSSTQFTARYVNAPGLNLLNLLPGLLGVSSKEYWDLERTFDTGNNAECYVKLFFMDQERSLITDLSDLTVAHYNGTSWEDMGVSDVTENSIISDIRVSNFSPFTLGSQNGNNQLPVELKDFDARYENNEVVIRWTTASEVNNDYFTVEHSANGVQYEKIGTVKGFGTTNEPQNYSMIHDNYRPGINYYRLTQTDFDGTTETFRPVSLDVKLPEENTASIYPNPLTGNLLKVRFSAPEEGNVEIIDQTGRKVFAQRIENAGYEQELRLPSTLLSGIYIVNIKTATETQSFKLVKR